MHVAVLLSGGVDSSVALYHLLKRTNDVTAYFIKVWAEGDVRMVGSCPWEDDLHYARLVCEKFCVPLHVVSLQREYRETVIAYALSELKRGGAPSPDVFCNSMIKFGAFYDAVGRDVDCIVSGHYARVTHGNTLSRLLCARDTRKDQTYFLSHLSQSQLRKMHTPLGAYANKEHIRRIARKIQLPNAGRPDSQGLCFLGNNIRYADFVSHYLPRTPGDVVDMERGSLLGVHSGFWFYTIGQRRGLRLGGGPWYVVKKDCARNIIFVSRDCDQLARTSFDIGDIVINAPGYERKIHRGDPVRCRVKIRHTPHFTTALLKRHADNSYRIWTDAPVHAVAAGQRAALYVRGHCIGGGRIAA